MLFVAKVFVQVRALLRLGAFPEVDVDGAKWLGSAGSCRAAAYAELMQQVALGDTGRVQKLIKLVGIEPLPTDLASFGGDTPLHWASSFGQADVAKVLLQLGASVDAANDDGVTPLHEAVKSSNTPIAMLLLESGANTDAVVGDGRDSGKTALDLVKDEALRAELSERIGRVKQTTQSTAPDTVRNGTVDETQIVQETANTPGPSIPRVTACRAPMVWPPPRRCRLLQSEVTNLPEGEGDLEISSETGVLDVAVESASSMFAEAVGSLSQLLAVRLNPVVPGDLRFFNAKIRMSICTITTSGPEAYRIAVTSQCARLIAADSSGLRYGVASLAQLLRFYATADGLSLKMPPVAVDDGPDARVRATTIDLRAMSGLSLPRMLDEFYRFASWRINTVFAFVDDSVNENFVEVISARCVLLGTLNIVPTWLVDSVDLPRRVEPIISAMMRAADLDTRGRSSDRRLDDTPVSGAGTTLNGDVHAATSPCVCRGFALKLPTQWVDRDFDDDLIVKRFHNYSTHVASAWSASKTANETCQDSQGLSCRNSGTLWLWGAGERATAACEAALDDAIEAAATSGCYLHLSLACVADSSLSSFNSRAQLPLSEAARVSNARPFSADCIIVGGADARRPTALRQAPLLASLVVAAKSCRAERAAGVLVRGAPTEPQLATYAKPFSDATTLMGAGLAWRADAGKDFSQSELEAVACAHLWRYDPPVAGTSGDMALEVRKKHLAAFLLGDEKGSFLNDIYDGGPSATDRRALAASALVCGRHERSNLEGDGRCRSLLAECQRGEHFGLPLVVADTAISGTNAFITPHPSQESNQKLSRLEDDEADLWPPAYSLRSLMVGGRTPGEEIVEEDVSQATQMPSDEMLRARAAAAAISKRFVCQLAQAARDSARDDSRSQALRSHLKRLSHLVKTAPDDRPDELWKWRHNESGFFFDSSQASAQYSDDDEEELAFEDDEINGANDDDEEPVFFFDRGTDPGPLDLRLRRIVDELRVRVSHTRPAHTLRDRGSLCSGIDGSAAMDGSSSYPVARACSRGVEKGR